MSITKKIALDSPLYMRFVPQIHKFQIGVNRGYSLETKNCPKAVFPTIFITGI